ncbi:alpha/beta-hydrolase [Trametes versicolor FP-101664 SS1]|uniref:alpha/beta-hydrolase n=1 Tax=Trametes versicolor (strain FP-101664) TaxID=717944 RepID=UPI0004622DE4|nr:alpha/beta-hydrolase [Trametes versicolor FP-101664 SS1]EIW56049.1 alpha/beta-hydrolase [Trametes versicolor FP-101664 SS1]
MDPALYKEVAVQRGFTYRYYHSPPAQGKPTLLFVHGFPSTAYDWHKQVAYFQPLGYGILAPDLLGAGGTAKPLDFNAFRMNAMARDVMDILAAEGVQKVVGISHDWGSPLLSRLAVMYPESFLGYTWIAVPFSEPVTFHFELEALMAYSKAKLGYESYSYWEFFLKEDAHSVIQRNVDSFLQLMYPERPEDWMEHIAVRGKTAECVEGGPGQLLRGFEYTALRDNLLENGIQSALNWYRVNVENVNLDDSLKIPKESWKLQSPSLVFLALKDIVCTPGAARDSMGKYGGSDVEYCEVESGHWVQLECAEEMNSALRRWLETRGW